MSPDQLLTVRNLHLQLAGRQVLQDINFKLPSGQLIALLGPNGAGKTSLLRCMAGLLSPERGEIHIGENRLSDMPADTRARALSYLEQDADCHWPMSVEDVVALGRLPHRLSGWTLNDDCRLQIDRALKDAGLLSLRHRSVDGLSGGERRRVMLARSLATNAGILFADEPVSGLDLAHQLRMMELLLNKASEGMTIILVLHDLALAARYCHRLIMLEHGSIVADGSAAEVLTANRLAKTYGIEAHIDQIMGLPVILPVSAHSLS